MPPQHVENGDITIRVLEGRIARVLVEGNHTYTKRQLTAPFARLTQEPVAYRPDLEHALLVLNRLPNLEVTAVVRKGVEPDTVDVVLQVKDRRTADLGLDFDDFGNPAIGQDHTAWCSAPAA